ncbi:MAG: TetR/AcrR family transcriptional regulator [Alphaproteobacteria bacterium]
MTKQDPISSDTEPRKFQTRKSVATRNGILDATVQCFLELGYHRTTTTEIAKRAGVTRGAVQYYFPTTGDVLGASIDHMIDQWIETYAEELRKMPESANRFAGGVDIYWRFVKHPLFVAWQELQAAARTAPELKPIVDKAAKRYDRRRRDVGREVYKELSEVPDDTWDVARDLLRVAIEGLAACNFGKEEAKREEAVLDLLKQMMSDLLTQRGRG